MCEIGEANCSNSTSRTGRGPKADKLWTCYAAAGRMEHLRLSSSLAWRAPNEEWRMATVTAAPDTLTKIQDAIAYLRDAGREDEANAVESLLPAARPRRLPPTPPVS